MRLYLSSYHLGDSSDQLLALMQGGKRACIIGNALDYVPDEARREYAENNYDPKKELAALGVEVHDFDLRKYFSRQDNVHRDLEHFDLVWVPGGNAFLLLRAMVQSGFDKVIRAMLAEDAIVYGGFSAGAVVATPTLLGIDIMDDPNQLADGYSAAPVWDGLGLVDFSIVPHYRSDHPEAPAAEKAINYLAEKGLPFKALRDGEVLTKDGCDMVLRPRNTASE